MRYSALILLVALGCNQRWSDEQIRELSVINESLISNIDLRGKYYLTNLKFIVSENGNREADLEVIKECEAILDGIMKDLSTDSILLSAIQSDQRRFDVERLFNQYDKHDAMYPELNQSQLMDVVVDHYSKMVGTNCICFDTPMIMLWRSLDHKNKYQVSACSSRPDRDYVVIAQTENELTVVDPLLNQMSFPLEWELVDSKDILYYFPDE